MPTRTYAVGFNMMLKDGRNFRVNPGEQDVPDEVAKSRVAQFNEVDPPEDALTGYVPAYGMPGHMQHHFLVNRGASSDEIPTAQYARAAQMHAGAPHLGMVEDRSLAVAEGTVQDGAKENGALNLTGEHMGVAAGDDTGHDNEAAAEAANKAATDNLARQQAREQAERDATQMREKAAREEAERARKAEDERLQKARDEAAEATRKAEQERLAAEQAERDAEAEKTETIRRRR